jgi:hypothetical protein
MVRAIFVLLASVGIGLITGCTAQQGYGAAQGWQRNQCTKLPDKTDFDRCMSQTETTYESYKQQTEPGMR